MDHTQNISIAVDDGERNHDGNRQSDRQSGQPSTSIRLLVPTVGGHLPAHATPAAGCSNSAVIAFMASVKSFRPRSASGALKSLQCTVCVSARYMATTVVAGNVVECRQFNPAHRFAVRCVTSNGFSSSRDRSKLCPAAFKQMGVFPCRVPISTSRVPIRKKTSIAFAVSWSRPSWWRRFRSPARALLAGHRRPVTNQAHRRNDRKQRSEADRNLRYKTQSSEIHPNHPLHRDPTRHSTGSGPARRFRRTSPSPIGLLHAHLTPNGPFMPPAPWVCILSPHR